MKSIIFCICFYLVSLSAFANEEDKIIAVVQKWNSLHNDADVSDFLNLYTEQIYFYGKQKSKEESYQIKNQFITSDFSQQIVGSIDIHYYKSGIIKCDFTKKTTNKKRVKEYFSYLLLEKGSGRYKVAGESDYQTDQNLGTSPYLGEERGSANKSLLAGVAIVSLSLGVFIWKKRRSKANLRKENYVNKSEEESQGLKNREVRSSKVLGDAPVFDSEPSPEIKGKAFEEFVVKRFSKSYFKLTEWRGDKNHEGIYPASNQNPDLEYFFSSKTWNAKFAVECKWRQSFHNGAIVWAKDYQFNNYKNFEKGHFPVFVIIGVGGQASNPESIFIIPLKKITHTVLTEEFLKPYKKYGRGDFFLDAENMNLT